MSAPVLATLEIGRAKEDRLQAGIRPLVESLPGKVAKRVSGPYGLRVSRPHYYCGLKGLVIKQVFGRSGLDLFVHRTDFKWRNRLGAIRLPATGESASIGLPEEL